MIVYHEGKFYAVTPWTPADLMAANMAYEARERPGPTDERDREQVAEIRKAVNKSCGKLVEIEPYEV